MGSGSWVMSMYGKMESHERDFPFYCFVVISPGRSRAFEFSFILLVKLPSLSSLHKLNARLSCGCRMEMCSLRLTTFFLSFPSFDNPEKFF